MVLLDHGVLRLTRRAAGRRNLAPILRDFAPSLTVARLAHWLESPTRSLRQRMHREIGLSPKRALRVARLHTALRAAQRSCRSWADAAYAAGYTDQSHLTREMRSLLGETPTAWQQRGSADFFKTPRGCGQ